MTKYKVRGSISFEYRLEIDDPLDGDTVKGESDRIVAVLREVEDFDKLSGSLEFIGPEMKYRMRDSWD